MCTISVRAVPPDRGKSASYDKLSSASFIHCRPHDILHIAVDDLAQRTFEPRFVRLVDEAEYLVGIEIGDQERQRVGYRPQPALAFLYGCFRSFLVGNVQVGADKLQGSSLAVALDLRDRANPSRLTIDRSNYAIFGLVVFTGTRDSGEKVPLDPLAIFRMN